MYKLQIVSINKERDNSNDKDFFEVEAHIFSEKEKRGKVSKVTHATLRRGYPIEFSQKQIQEAMEQELRGWEHEQEANKRNLEIEEENKKVEKVIANTEGLVIE